MAHLNCGCLIRSFGESLGVFLLFCLAFLCLGSTASLATLKGSLPARPKGDAGAWESHQLAEDPRVHKLLSDLETKSGSARLEAALALGEMRAGRALAPLMDLLKNSPLAIERFVAATALGDIGDSSAVTCLVSVLEAEEDADVRSAAAIALGKIRDPMAVDSLIENLENENSDVRRWAAAALGSIKDPRSVFPLIAALGDEMYLVRLNAARSLGEIRDPLAVDPLIASCSGDSFPDVRWWSAHALGEIRDPRATRPLTDMVRTKDHQDVAVVRDAFEPLGSVFTNKHPSSSMIKDAIWSVQIEAIGSLGKIGECALDALISILFKHKETEFRIEAAKMLVNIKGLEYINGLLEEREFLRIVRGICGHLIARGEEGTEDSLINAIHVWGDLKMSMDFMRSRNSKLIRAAEAWMKKNGYDLPDERAIGGPLWGEDKKALPSSICEDHVDFHYLSR